MRKVLFPVVALATSLSFANDPNVGFKIGVFLPTNSAVKTALGDSWLSYGINFGTIQDASGRSMGADTSFLSREANGNRIFMGTLSYGVLMPLGGMKYGSAAQPYLAVRAGATYADYRIGAISENGILFNGNVEVGINVGSNMNLSARYDLVGKTNGFDFSGATLQLKWQILSF